MLLWMLQRESLLTSMQENDGVMMHTLPDVNPRDTNMAQDAFRSAKQLASNAAANVRGPFVPSGQPDPSRPGERQYVASAGTLVCMPWVTKMWQKERSMSKLDVSDTVRWTPIFKVLEGCLQLVPSQRLTADECLAILLGGGAAGGA
eukprot:3028558-Rhodomonas_salina.6